MFSESWCMSLYHPPVFLYSYSFVYVLVCARVRVEGWRGQRLLWVSASVALWITLSLSQLLFRNVKFTSWLDWLSSKPPELSFLPGTGVRGACGCPRLCVAAGAGTQQALVLARQALCWLSPSSSLFSLRASCLRRDAVLKFSKIIRNSSFGQGRCWLLFGRVLRHCSWSLRRSPLPEQLRSYWRGQKDWPSQWLRTRRTSSSETSTLNSWGYGSTGNWGRLEIRSWATWATEVRVQILTLETALCEQRG